MTKRDARQELNEVVKFMSKQEIVRATNLLKAVVFFETQYKRDKIAIRVGKEIVSQLQRFLEQEGDMITTDIPIPRIDLEGKKVVPRKAVEEYLNMTIDRVNGDIKSFNFLSMIKSLFDCDFVPYIERPGDNRIPPGI